MLGESFAGAGGHGPFTFLSRRGPCFVMFVYGFLTGNSLKLHPLKIYLGKRENKVFLDKLVSINEIAEI